MHNSDIRETLSANMLPKVERQRLHDTVVDHLRNFIVEGLLAPGVKLNERTLCETLGISRTPLREALKVLAVEGLIDILRLEGVANLPSVRLNDGRCHDRSETSRRILHGSAD